MLLAALLMALLIASPGSAQVLDDEGRPIMEEEIDRYTDAGVSGGVIGGILGFAAGVGVTIAFVDLEGGNSTAYIAPIVLGAVGAFAGARLARVDREEASNRFAKSEGPLLKSVMIWE